MKPKITLFAAAARPQYWMDFYNSLGENNVSFEIIFVGPNEPDFVLPRNLHFIKTNVKPTQCFEIGLRNAKAPLVMNVADDCEFCTDHPLDKLHTLYTLNNNEKLILSCYYMLNGVERPLDHFFFVGNPNSPVMPMHSLMSRKLYDKVGGIDKNFIAVFWDLDIAMRVYAIGGEILMTHVYSNEAKVKNEGVSLCADYFPEDRELLESFWVDCGKICKKRLIPVTPFSNYRILEETQGPKGRW